MFGMSEGLKLSRALGIPVSREVRFHGATKDLREELWLRAVTFCPQTSRFAGVLNGGEIDVRCQILLANIRQQVVADAVLMMGAQSSFQAGWRNHFISGETVINREKFAVRQNSSGFVPPIFGGG